MESAYDAKKYEDEIYQLWEKSGYFSPEKLPSKGKKKYVVLMAPPNITGSLHLGHTLEDSTLDVLLRYKRMRGYKTLWIPGTDHAGIATQNVVEKELKREGKNRFDLGREDFIQRVWQWKEKYGNLIYEQWKKLGLSVDWSKIRFTLDRDYHQSVLEAFISYFQNGWIYRGRRVINWCPHCQTSISDLEVKHQEEKTKFYYLKYPIAESQKSLPGTDKPLGEKIKNQKFIIVATTRPETMLGDAAVAVNPKDSRYRNLVGKFVLLPIVNRKIPIISDKGVDKTFGTGALKVTPSHSIADSEIAQRHNLEFFDVINENEKIINVVNYNGLKIKEAREKIVEEFKALGLLVKTEEINHAVALCDRCSTVVENLPSWQWFLKMQRMALLAKWAVRLKRTRVFPVRWEKSYFDWLDNVKDWCISRQLWWGHRLPVWHCAQCNSIKIKREKNYFIDSQGLWLVSAGSPKECPNCKTKVLKQVDDVLDTWFSSALWPFAILGWPNKTKDLKEFYPADLVSSAPEILHLWITRMIFSGIYFLKSVPFKKVYIHATVLTLQGKRMSKSLGTGIDPSELIDKYGSDAVRFGILWQAMGGQAIRFDGAAIESGKRLANKIWNASRLVSLRTSKEDLQNINEPKDDLSELDKIILRELKDINSRLEKMLDNFEVSQALHLIYRSFWNNFCDKYLEEAKKRGDEVKGKLIYFLVSYLKLWHPFMPFVTEAIWQKLSLADKNLLIVEQL